MNQYTHTHTHSTEGEKHSMASLQKQIPRKDYCVFCVGLHILSFLLYFALCFTVASCLLQALRQWCAQCQATYSNTKAASSSLTVTNGKQTGDATYTCAWVEQLPWRLGSGSCNHRNTCTFTLDTASRHACLQHSSEQHPCLPFNHRNTCTFTSDTASRHACLQHSSKSKQHSCHNIID